jgi:hypothetical protein
MKRQPWILRQGRHARIFAMPEGLLEKVALYMRGYRRAAWPVSQWWTKSNKAHRSAGERQHG